MNLELSIYFNRTEDLNLETLHAQTLELFKSKL